MGEAIGRRRAIPAVDTVLRSLGNTDLPRPVVVEIIRQELDLLRGENEIPELAEIYARIEEAILHLRRSRIQPVINATGVVIHTNLGRSPLAPEVAESLVNLATSYSNLEFDLRTGERGSRGSYVEKTLALLCEAEAATVVNNCAAALVLIVRHFTAGEAKEVIISRGELVQIGGGFRIPEILEASGARLREIGTTNKTTLEDYRRAAGSGAALILRVHRSNFSMQGFVESPPTAMIAEVAKELGVPFVEDLGSGAVICTEQLARLEHEPTPQEAMTRGVDLVCFSGDKLFGGPQAGVIAGKAGLIAALKKEPLFRALRCDKLILSALQRTVEIYLERRSEALPIVKMLRQSVETLEERAKAIIKMLAGVQITIHHGTAQVGGGALPRSEVPSVVLRLKPVGISPAALSKQMRAQSPPVIGYVAGDSFNLDLRTVFPEQDKWISRAVQRVLELEEPGCK